MSYRYLKTQLDRAVIAFVYDEGVDPAWARLRILPAIRYLEVSRYTFPKRWRQLGSPRQYDYLDYEYALLGEMSFGDEPLCAISSQNYEDHTEYTIRPVLERYKGYDSPLVVAAERSDFDPQGGQRELQEQPFVEKLGSYTQVYREFEDHYREFGFDCPLQDTTNLFLQDNANIYELVTGETLSSTIELFTKLPDLPFLPLYRVFVDMFAREDGPGASPLPTYAHVEGFGRWLRRRIEWDRQTGLRQARRLNRAVDSDGRTFAKKTRMRCTNHHDVASALNNLGAGSEIHARYRHWLEVLTHE